MRRGLSMGVIAGLLLMLSPPALAVKFTFDLSEGPAGLEYSTIGAYNPIRLTLEGFDGAAKTWFGTELYDIQVALETAGKLLLSQIASVTGMDLEARLAGQFRSSGSMRNSNFSILVSGSGILSVQIDPDSGGIDTEETEIHTKVLVEAKSGRLVVEDSRPEPLPGEAVGYKLGMPRDVVDSLVEDFGRARVEAALENALSHNGAAYAQGSSIAGGAASVVSDGSLSINSLSPRAVFDLSLQGLRYEGYLRDSTLYMRLLHPANGVSIRDMRVILTVVELEPPEPLHGPHIVLWDVFPYDYQAGCYLYHLNSTGWRPGSYEVYIDVGQIVNFKLPITITDWHQVVARRG